MTETEQDAYWVDGLDPADVKKVQESMMESELKVMRPKGKFGLFIGRDPQGGF